MWALFLKSIAMHLEWWFASLIPGRHPSAPLSFRRLLFLLLAYPVFLLLQLIHWLGFLVDELLFRDYRYLRIEEPLFITGIPRSGTTFLHRTLANDPRYTYFRTWEAILAPSISERKIILGLAALDRKMGSPLKRALNGAITRCSGDFDSIHQVLLDAPEEDYLALLPAAACFILLLAFPFSSTLADLARLDQLPEARRKQLIGFYRRCLQKHLYCHPGKQLLSKNAAFSSWTPELLRAFSGAHLVICIRRPDTALSSQLSSLAPARNMFATDPDGTQTTMHFTAIYAHNYKLLADLITGNEDSSLAIIDQADLRADAAGTIRAALKIAQVPPSEVLLKALDRLQPGPPSSHNHAASDFSIDREQIESCMQPAYAAMLRSTKRSRPPAN
jgi:hypothetical protein